jgi:nucleotide-binding universal stress UspA family protein
MITPLRRIVAGLATLSRGDPALVPAIRLAERTGADLHLVHVRAGAGDDARLLARMEAEVAALTARGRITCRVVTGRAGDALPLLAAELEADLLVLGHTRRGGALGAVLGTTAQRVLRASTVPVLSLHANARAAHARVLLATDLSPHSAAALAAGVRLAGALAQPAEPRFHPLYVTVHAYEAVAAGIPEWSPEHAVRELAEFLGEIPGLAGVPGAVRIGDAADGILREAEEWQADLVVVGTHGRRGLPRFLLGSAAESVLRRASVSVLAIPPGMPPRAVTQPTPPAEEEASSRTAEPTPVAASPAPRRRARPAPVPFRSILAATDLTSASDHVLRSAAIVAEATGAGLHVTHAFDFASEAYMGETADRATFQGRIAAAEAALDAQIARTVPPGVVVVDRRVEVYVAHRAILEHARACDAELVVVGAHTHRGSQLGVLGSTTDRLIRTLQVPVLVVRTELGLPLHRVVVPLDLSEPGRAALEIGVRWAGALGVRGPDVLLPETEVAVVHVVPQLLAVADPPFERATVPPGLNREVDAAVGAAGGPSNVLVREEVLWNDRPATAIVSFAWRERADLLVLSTHGHHPVKRALVGATAMSVVRRAPCPVLLVPPRLWRRRPLASAGSALATAIAA